MESILLPSKKYWSSIQVGMAGALGGLLAGFYLFSENYRSLGYPQLAKKTLITWAVSFFIILIAITVFDERYSLFFFIGQAIAAGSYVFYEHSKIIDGRQSKKELCIALPIFFQLLTVGALTIPQIYVAHTPGFVYALIPLVTMQSLYQYLQWPYLQEPLRDRKAKGSNLKLFGIIIGAMLIQLGLIFATLLILG
ncbi:MAG: hypothetical protein LW832_06130 [Parachlamydia sp.]|jgi:hypothetical protein|nr:hypothetical protein [Parachlamydia sp.]